eukprot:GHRQ01026031.1.p1 GENE.GHRQ01026031.1~~GHRQ01026031.1.p1  ORF type:complete len:153 (+),score=55.58 GHRQ01026031.1:306-764(+)
MEALTCPTPLVLPLLLLLPQVDLDLGNYERFLDITLTRDNNLTTGKVYQVWGWNGRASVSKSVLRTAQPAGMRAVCGRHAAALRMAAAAAAAEDADNTCSCGQRVVQGIFCVTGSSVQCTTTNSLNVCGAQTLWLQQLFKPYPADALPQPKH